MIYFVYLDYGFFTLYAFTYLMQPHPIPQNVTSFQFHLVGDMTLKQFIYLAIGATIAYVFFVFVAPKYPILAWPIIVLSASSGAAFAFLPINSRPLDYWLGAFLKAIYSPTKRVWKKSNRDYKEDPLFNSRFVAFLSGLQPSSPLLNNTKIDTTILAQQTAAPIQQPPLEQPKTELPSKDELAKTVDLAREAQHLQYKIIQTERTLSQIKQASQNQGPVAVDYASEVNKVLADLQTLITQASGIKDQLEHVTKSPIPHPQIKATVKVVIPEKPKQNQLVLTTFPNVISGIVKDLAGNYLEGVVAVIYDKEGLPVRALKTNKLGQFTGSTPLPNATYTLELEKNNFTFDVLQIELVGEILPPLMITSKN